MNSGNQALNMLTANSAKTNDINQILSSCQQTSNLSDNERQLALASLFSSLSSLAHNQRQQQFQQQQQQQQPPPPPLSGNEDHHTVQSMAPTSGSSMATIQSVVAAAMMQQQFAQHPSQPSALPAFSISDPQAMGNLFAGQQNDVQFGASGQASNQQRINYCTICNKELCNKYFMKTHMLKMHGINLEMEQPGDDQSDQDQAENEQDEGESSDGNEQQTTSTDLSMNHSDQTKLRNDPVSKKSPRPSSSGGKKSGKSSSATSVMNGFAGNSMGGVVCDICNKELCSKYFLKVHKQNTHGIMTDYQDHANPFVYPFVPPNPFMNPATATLPPLPPQASALASSPNPLSYFGSQNSLEDHSPKRTSNASKKIKLSNSSKQSIDIGAQDDSSHAGQQQQQYEPNNAQLDSVYRLMLAQQQFQQQQPPPNAVSAAPIPMMPMSLDPAANQMGALMCFGAMAAPSGPFGPATMSPAMIVDNILRNQHLFNRNNMTAHLPQTAHKGKGTGSSATTTDSNNNTDSSKSSTSGKKVSSKDQANNSKYFSHYTEACPMCDRRFKSIKWLKTHMMNDHKQEIGAYMQMMMQYLYTSKTQQQMAAAAATMAAMEQQSFAMHNRHSQQSVDSVQSHSLSSQSSQLPPHYSASMTQQPKQQLPQQPPFNSLLGKCLNLAGYKEHQPSRDQQHQNHHDQQQVNTSKFGQSNPLDFHLNQNQLGGDFAIDARCKTESSSSCGSPNANRQDNQSDLSLSFELSRLSSHNNIKTENFFANTKSEDFSIDDDTSNQSDCTNGGETDDRASQQQQLQLKTTSS